MVKSRARRKPSLKERPGQRIGYGGNAPQFVAARDVMGMGHRAKIDGPQNINVDRLEWLLHRKLIEPHHHSAGRKLQQFWETAEISSGVSLVGGGGGGMPSTSLSDAKCDAMQAINGVRAAMSPLNFRLVELVVIDRLTAVQACKKMGYDERAATVVLTHALDSLARHFKMC